MTSKKAPGKVSVAGVAYSAPFYTDEMRRWLGGYEPVIAAEMCVHKTPRIGARRPMQTMSQRMARQAAV